MTKCKVFLKCFNKGDFISSSFFFLMWSHHFFHFHRSIGMNNLLVLHSIYCITKMTSKRPKYYAPLDRLEWRESEFVTLPGALREGGRTSGGESALNHFFTSFYQRTFSVQQKKVKMVRKFVTNLLTVKYFLSNKNSSEMLKKKKK